MYLKWGAYKFPDNSLVLSITKETVRGPDGKPVSQKLRWRASGSFIAAGPAALGLKLSQMDNALQRPYQDLTFNTASGAPVLALRNQGSYAGVVVTSVELPEDKNAFATYVPFAFTAEAEYPLVGVPIDAPRYTAWSESIEVSGGLPDIVYRKALNARPQRQVVSGGGEFVLVQSGEATALYRRVVISPPLPVGGDLVDYSLRETQSGVTFSAAWSYTFKSVARMLAHPRGVPLI